MNCETTHPISRNDQICPICKSNLIFSGLFWCDKCKKWFEEIDFLDIPKESLNIDCKTKCIFLKETEFKKNGQTLYYCNNPKTDRIMEKINDFRGCVYIEEKTE